MTVRDEVWHEAILQLIKSGKFKLADLPFDESQRHTARRVLREMEEKGWLTRETENAAYWRMGELAKLHLNVSQERIKQAES